MEIEIRINGDIVGDGKNFRTVVDKRTQEKIFHLGDKDGQTHIWINRMIPLDKVHSALNKLQNVSSSDTSSFGVANS